MTIDDYRRLYYTTRVNRLSSGFPAPNTFLKVMDRLQSPVLLFRDRGGTEEEEDLERYRLEAADPFHGPSARKSYAN